MTWTRGRYRPTVQLALSRAGSDPHAGTAWLKWLGKNLYPVTDLEGVEECLSAVPAHMDAPV